MKIRIGSKFKNHYQRFHRTSFEHFNRKLKRRSSAHRIWLNFWAILGELLLIALVSGYFISPFNRIQKTEVWGNQTVATPRLERNLRVNQNDSLTQLLLDGRRFKRQALKRDVQLKRIRVNLYHWNRVRVQVNESPMIANLKSHRNFYSVFQNGQIANKTQHSQPNFPILTGFTFNRQFKRFVQKYQRLPLSVRPDILEIELTPTEIDPDRIHVWMNDGNQIYANFNDWSTKMKYYSAISRSMRKRGIINMEVGVYSRPYRRR